jgi:hypothetical protein
MTRGEVLQCNCNELFLKIGSIEYIIWFYIYYYLYYYIYSK